MNLFSDVEKKNKSESTHKSRKNTAQSLIVISPDKERLSEIVDLLTLNNFRDVTGHVSDFFSLQDDSLLRSAATVVVDIATCDDVERISSMSTLLIPASARQIFLGENDSISFSQSLMVAGICYLHRQSQLTQLTNLLQTTDLLKARNIMRISLLGCKGGVGTSSVAWQLFQAIGMQTSIPSLLVQGASGSRDLDLITSHDVPRDGTIVPVSEHQSLRIESLDGAWNYGDSHFNRFNLVMFDHSVCCQPGEYLERIFTESGTLILVVNRDLGALRIAKYLLAEKQRVDLARSGQAQRVFICLNESRPAQNDDLRNDDIETWLGCPLSVFNPWNTKKTPAVTATSFWQFAAQNLLGKPAAESGKKRGLFGLFR